MPKDQTRPELRSPNQHSDPSGSRRRERKRGKKAQDGQQSASQRPLTNLDTAHPSQSLFEGAHSFRMRDFNVISTVPQPHTELVDGWKLLVDNISPNALHNSSARYDAPKCDEDTRVELTRELMDRIKDRENPQRLLCMTGAAGEGKSALQQTIAERCENSGILGSAYFFVNADPTRNTISTVVPTIAYQLGSHNPALKQAIGAAVAQDTVIFKKSLRTQMDSLIVRPLRYLQECAGLDLATVPHAILIDGLDECRGEDRQEELLTAVRECLLSDDLPFYVVIASRPELPIRAALAPGGYLRDVAYHIQLSDYYASGDMRRFLRTRFKQLSLRTGNPHWFTEDNIQTLVREGSGQFIYVSTVYRWISEPRASPVERLKTVLTWTPHKGQKARPFEALDQLYRNILLNAKNAYESVDTHSGRDFLLLLKMHHINVVNGFSYFRGAYRLPKAYFTDLLGLGDESVEILISDLHSLVSIEMNDLHYLRILHKSFSDFLNTESRAKDLYVPPSRAYSHLAKCCLLYIFGCPDSEYLSSAILDLPQILAPQGVLVEIDDELIDFSQKGGWAKIDSPNVHPRRKRYYPYLLEQLGVLTEGVRKRNPEVVEVMRTYFEEWKREYDDICAGIYKWNSEAKDGSPREMTVIMPTWIGQTLSN